MTEALQIGQALPRMEVETADGQRKTVQSHLGSGRTLLYFLHGTWCPACVGQYHLLQRYLPRIRETGADLVVVTGEEPEALTTFLRSAHPSLDYMVLTDPKRTASRAINAKEDMLAIILDAQGLVRWQARWPDHQGEPAYETILHALEEIRNAEAGKM